jgi:phage baseplate assembly protein W
MAKTYGIDFPFNESRRGTFFNMTETPDREIRANLLHLILTRRGTRYYLPDFGPRLYEYLFDLILLRLELIMILITNHLVHQIL